MYSSIFVIYLFTLFIHLLFVYLFILRGVWFIFKEIVNMTVSKALLFVRFYREIKEMITMMIVRTVVKIARKEEIIPNQAMRIFLCFCRPIKLQDLLISSIFRRSRQIILILGLEKDKLLFFSIWCGQTCPCITKFTQNF